MVTVRTYLSQAEAALAKSLLDDCEIFCALWYENAHVWCRAQWAVPIHLVVVADEAELAARILRGDTEIPAEENEPMQMIATQPALQKDNPWELLVIAYYFFLPAVAYLQVAYPQFRESSGYHRYLIAKVTIAHFLGWIAVIFAAFLVATYFHTRRKGLASF